MAPQGRLVTEACVSSETGFRGTRLRWWPHKRRCVLCAVRRSLLTSHRVPPARVIRFFARSVFGTRRSAQPIDDRSALLPSAAPACQRAAPSRDERPAPPGRLACLGRPGRPHPQLGERSRFREPAEPTLPPSPLSREPEPSLGLCHPQRQRREPPPLGTPSAYHTAYTMSSQTCAANDTGMVPSLA
jgi:hypothetical protein